MPFLLFYGDKRWQDGGNISGAFKIAAEIFSDKKSGFSILRDRAKSPQPFS
jgi:hypothetical protein